MTKNIGRKSDGFLIFATRKSNVTQELSVGIMETSYYLAVDLGATSGRTVLAAFDGQKVELRELTRFKNPMIPMSGHLYWDLPALYYQVLQALKRVAEERIPLVSVGIDTWGCDFSLFTADGRLASLPYSYRDAHTEGSMEKFFARIPAETVYGHTGIQFMEFNSLFQLDTLKREGCKALEMAEKILFTPDALSYLLTGQAVAEYTVASTSQLLNPSTGDLDAELLAALGLPRGKFGRVVLPGTVVGRLTPQVRQYTGLPELPVVAVAGHDTASAVAAIPAVDGDFAYLSCGTWSLLGVEMAHPVITADSFRHNFTNEGGVNGTIRLLKNICGMWLLERCRAGWGETSYPELIAEANASEPFRNLIAPDDPVFANPADMEEAIKSYCLTHKQPAIETRGQIVRCIFESLALRYRQVLENLQHLSPNPIETLHVIGGGSRNELLNQWTANAIGIPVIAGLSEATAIGNIMLQALAAGKATDFPQMRCFIAQSIPLKTYQPKDKEAWNAAYLQFKNVTQ